jgi:hypothetical protein
MIAVVKPVSVRGAEPGPNACSSRCFSCSPYAAENVSGATTGWFSPRCATGFRTCRPGSCRESRRLRPSGTLPSSGKRRYTAMVVAEIGRRRHPACESAVSRRPSSAVVRTESGPARPASHQRGRLLFRGRLLDETRLDKIGLAAAGLVVWARASSPFCFRPTAAFAAQRC